LEYWGKIEKKLQFFFEKIMVRRIVQHKDSKMNRKTTSMVSEHTLLKWSSLWALIMPGPKHYPETNESITLDTTKKQYA
jgi:hypothetical protein